MPVERNPYVPPAPGPLQMDQFAGLNTSTTRMGVPDEQCAWIDGFFPLDKYNLRTLYDVGTTLYTAVGTTIVFFGFVNISATPYMILFQADGSVVAVNTLTATVGTVLPVGTIANPSQLTIGLSQWGQQYAIIVANQTNGYWLWDGLLTYSAGTLGPGVILTNIGSGYTSPPLVTASGGHGSGAVFAAFLNNSGNVASVAITNPGTGYLVGDSVSLTFFGGLSAGSGASLTASLTHLTGGSGALATISAFSNITSGGVTYFQIKTIAVITEGSNYSQFTKISTQGGIAFTPALLTPVIAGGQITGVSIVGGSGSAGSGLFTTKPNVTLSIVDTGGYAVGSVNIVAPGSGYSNFPVLTYTVAAGQSLIQSPVLTPIVTNGSISSVAIVTGGLQQGSVAGTIVITDTASAAAGSVTLMPFGVSGNAVETYSGHVWVAQQNNLQWSGPGSPANFATSVGGGSQQSNASYLKIGYTRLVQSNGFLYLIGDSSLDYISGVQTAGTIPTTTFTQQNADPTIGTPYPWSVILHGQDLLFANSVGIYGVAGARPTKISQMLDGIWGTVPNFGGLNLSAAHAEIFNREVWMTLATFVDPVSNTSVTKTCMWDGKRWFVSPQNMQMAFIGSQEINSVFTTYGTDGTIVAPLFSTPSTAFEKVVQSKLWADPGGYLLNHAAGRFWAVAQYYSVSAPSITAVIDAVAADPAVAGSIVSTSASYTIAGPSITGPWVTPPQAVGQQGILTGLMIKTHCADMALVSAMIDDKIVGYRG
jgi:hypothetical protein